MHFAVLSEASLCSCHLYTKWEQHKRKVVGWHDDSGESKSKELLGPIMNVWSNVHVSTHPHMHTHTQADMHMGNILHRCTSHKGEQKMCLSKNNPLFKISQVCPKHPLQSLNASHLTTTIWCSSPKMTLRGTLTWL